MSKSKILDLKITAQICYGYIAEESKRGVFLRNQSLIAAADRALTDYSDQLSILGSSFVPNEERVLNVIHEGDRVRAWHSQNRREAYERRNADAIRAEAMSKISTNATFQ